MIGDVLGISGAGEQGVSRQVDRDLASFSGAGYDKGRGRCVQVLWLAVSTLIFARWWLPSRVRVSILRGFGATVGRNVLIRQNVRIHWPWKLIIGDGTWIGDSAWILNLEPVTVGSNVCISQAAFICTGSHDRTSATFEFDNAPIEIGDGAWVAARAMVLRGTKVEPGETVPANEVRSVKSGRLDVSSATRGSVSHRRR